MAAATADVPEGDAGIIGGLASIQAAVRAGLGAAALLPANLEPGTATHGLPPLPDVELGLIRRPGTDGDPLVDAVERVLRRLT